MTACCSKINCGYERYPYLSVELLGFNNTGSGQVRVIEKESNIAIDSFTFYNNAFRIERTESEFKIREYTYIILSEENRRDTLSSINFEMYEYMNNCNECFGFTKEGEIATDYRNLSYDLNGTTYTNTQEVKIYK